MCQASACQLVLGVVIGAGSCALCVTPRDGLPRMPYSQKMNAMNATMQMAKTIFGITVLRSCFCRTTSSSIRSWTICASGMLDENPRQPPNYIGAICCQTAQKRGCRRSELLTRERPPRSSRLRYGQSMRRCGALHLMPRQERAGAHGVHFPPACAIICKPGRTSMRSRRAAIACLAALALLAPTVLSPGQSRPLLDQQGTDAYVPPVTAELHDGSTHGTGYGYGFSLSPAGGPCERALVGGIHAKVGAHRYCKDIPLVRQTLSNALESEGWLLEAPSKVPSRLSGETWPRSQ